MGFREQFVGKKVKEWLLHLEGLREVGLSHPHTAHAAFTKGVKGRWTYLLRTIPGAGPLVRPLDEAIEKDLKPVLIHENVKENAYRGGH